MTYILKTHNLNKVYNGNEVVSGVNLKIKKGEIYGFLGPNGAGKTTIMKMISNLIKPTSGEIEIFGNKLENESYEVLKRLGIIIEYPMFYDRLTARQNLELHLEYMGYYDKKSIDNALDLVGLKNIEGKKVKDFSLGMKQRLGVARAIATKPEFLILDEPTNGLDPVGIKEFRQLFKMLSREYGITIMISSHILGDIEQIADTIGIINSGRLIEEVSMSEIKESNTEYIEITTTDHIKASYVLADQLNISNFKVLGDNLIRVYDLNVPQSVVSKTLIMNDVIIESITSKNASLEDYFLNILEGGEIIA